MSNLQLRAGPVVRKTNIKKIHCGTSAIRLSVIWKSKEKVTAEVGNSKVEQKEQNKWQEIAQREKKS